MSDAAPALFDVSGITGGVGLAETVVGRYYPEKVLLGSVEYEIPGGVSFEATLSNVGDAIVLTGRASAAVLGTCTRCLGFARVEIDTELEGYFTLSEDSDVTGMEDDEYELVPEDGMIDLSEAVLSSVLVEIPLLFLCDEDCKGLCPRCGCNLNESECGCSELPDKSNPFYVLKDLLNDQ